MKNTADYKSRFRILKGGKISLVISALLIGSIASADVVNFTNDDINYIMPYNLNNKTNIENSSITNNGTFNMSNVRNYAIQLENVQNISNTTITNSGVLNVPDIYFGPSIGISIQNSSISPLTKIDGLTITNSSSGEINASSTSLAYGVLIDNPYISYEAKADSNITNLTINNAGNMTISSTNPSYAKSEGIKVAYSITNSTITNQGTIDVNATSSVDSRAYAIQTFDLNNSSITNNSVINATAGTSTGIMTGSLSNNSSVNNDSNITVVSGGYYAKGIWTLDLDNSSATNSGTIEVTSLSLMGWGIVARNLKNNSSITNSGTISVNSGSGIFVNNVNNSSVLNEGAISVVSGAGISTNDLDNSSVRNEGTISVTSGTSSSYGINTHYLNTNSSVRNEGTISVNTGAFSGYGIKTNDLNNSSSVVNNSDVNVTSASRGYGIDTGDLMNGSFINNSANVNIISVKKGSGLKADDLQSGSSIVNSGNVNINDTGDDGGFGIFAKNLTSSSFITNSGQLKVVTTKQGTGISTSDLTSSSITNTNLGTIEVSSVDEIGTGISASSMDNSSISNNGSIEVTSENEFAKGIFSTGLSNNSTINNNGMITVDAGKNSYGIQTYSLDTNSSIINDVNGQIVLTSGTLDDEEVTQGIEAGNLTDSSVINRGIIKIDAETSGMGLAGGTLSGTSTINNSGTIMVDSQLNSYGIFVEQLLDSSTIINSSTITAKKQGMFDASAYSLYIEDGASSASIINETTGKLYGNIFVDGAAVFTNKGLISLPSNANGVNSAKIGAFENKSGSILEISVDDAITSSATANHYSQLVTNSATLDSGSIIQVKMQDVNTQLSVGTRLENVLVADVNTPESLKVSNGILVKDNSMLFDFTHVQEDEKLHLDVIASQESGGSATIEGVVTKNGGNNNTTNAARALDTIRTSGNTAMRSKLNELDTITNVSAYTQAVTSTTPLVATANAGAGTQIMSGMQGIVEMRQNANFGLNSGDGLFQDRNVWIKPYISSGSQNNKNGINGFDLRTSGVGIGIDGEYNTNQNIGLAFFYTKAKVDVNNVTQNSDLDVMSTLIYGNIPIMDDKTNFLYQVGYAWQKTNSSRTNFDDSVASADYTSTTASLDLKLMRNYEATPTLLMQPMLQATYRRFDNPSYSETGAGVLNQHLNSFSAEEMILSVGTLAHYKLGQDSGILASANVGYDFKHDITTVSSEYEGSLGTSFETRGIDNGRWNYAAGIGYEINNILGGELNFMYDYEAKGTDFKNNTLSTKYTMKF